MLTFGIKRDKRGNFLGNLKKRLQELDNTELEVGYFPQLGTHTPSKLTYAGLFAIHSFGSPSKGIPARPVLDLQFSLFNPVDKNLFIKNPNDISLLR